MEKLCILFMIFLALKGIRCSDEEQGKFTYPTCVEGELWMAIAVGKREFALFRENNTGIVCKRYCLSLQYKLAGTKGKFCFCSNRLKKDVNSSTCAWKCPGDVDESCGGQYGISLHDTGFHDEGTTVVDMTTESTQTTTETAETALPHSTTKTQSSTEAASTRTQITEESLISGTKDTAKTESLSKEIVYIAVPVVIVVSGTIAVLICLIVRRRRVKRECSVRYHTDNPHPPGHNSEVDKNAENDSLIENPNDNQMSTKLRIENSTSAADSVTEYNTVYSTGSPQSVNTYSCLRTHPGIGLTTSSEYSHMKVITTTNPIAICTENTYSHIGDDSEIGKKSREQSTENGSERDNTYNTLQASPQKHAVDKISRSEGDPDTVYDRANHAEAGVGYQKGNTADEYEHLNSIKTGTVTAGQCNIAREKVNLVCESLDSESNGMYEEAGHNYFILEPKK